MEYEEESSPDSRRVGTERSETEALRLVQEEGWRVMHAGGLREFCLEQTNAFHVSVCAPVYPIG